GPATPCPGKRLSAVDESATKFYRLGRIDMKLTSKCARLVRDVQAPAAGETGERRPGASQLNSRQVREWSVRLAAPRIAAGLPIGSQVMLGPRGLAGLRAAARSPRCR